MLMVSHPARAKKSTKGNGPTAAQKVDLMVRVDPAAQMECQMQVQHDGGALLCLGLIPSGIGAETGGAANGGVLVGDLAIQGDLSGRVSCINMPAPSDRL